ncbi:MAG: glutamine--fructose-6-phosphate transaminase (isomerizing) [Planctomycetota bacterium]
MCGIVGYVGEKFADNILIVGLRRLEYRGYDSSGIAVIEDGEVQVTKARGKLAALDEKLHGRECNGTTGIGHTRWATHGEPSERNAHPHTDATGSLAVVHNGIISNYLDLRRELEAEGILFRSETDTEVLPHLISRCYRADPGADLAAAVRRALAQVKGTYALAVVHADHPGVIVAARKGSPLVVGVGEGEHLIASDVAAMVTQTRDVIYLEDGDVVAITPESHVITDLIGGSRRRPTQHIDLDPAHLERGDFPHFMLKEIYEQPQVLRGILQARCPLGSAAEPADIQFGTAALEDKARLGAVGRIVLTACGTSWHAGLVAKKWFEELAGIQTEVDTASEFRYRNPILAGDTLCITISQSGETADTLEGLRKARAAFLKTLSFVNVPQSTIARESDYVIKLLAGTEIGVASTKAYTAQLVNLFLLALHLARLKRRIDETTFRRMIDELHTLPAMLETVLGRRSAIERVADRFAASNTFIFLGRGYNVPTAMEAALKLKEISYIHATSYPAGEFKHGPIALIDIHTPTVAVMPNDASFERMSSNVQEVRARKGPVIVLTTDDAPDVSHLSEHVLKVPAVPEYLMPIVSIVPLQLLAYEIAVMRGCEVDKPRNLAKSVTVE